MSTFVIQTPYRKGYFVSQEQQDLAIGRIVRERAAAKARLTALKNEALQLGKTFEGLGNMLQKDADRLNIAIESYELYLSDKSAKDIRKLKSDILETEAELTRLTSDFKNLGIEV